VRLSVSQAYPLKVPSINLATLSLLSSEIQWQGKYTLSLSGRSGKGIAAIFNLPLLTFHGYSKDLLSECI
jgi:hypothetical protein